MITYLVGDATNPEQKGTVILVHVCNDIGAFGAGIAKTIDTEFPEVGEAYRDWKQKPGNLPFQLGEVQLVQTYANEFPDTFLSDLYVANMIAQKGIRQSGKDFDVHAEPPIRYEAVEKCLNTVAVIAKSIGACVVGPRFGAGLAGGEWSKIEAIINKTMGDIPVFIYDLPK